MVYPVRRNPSAGFSLKSLHTATKMQEEPASGLHHRHGLHSFIYSVFLHWLNFHWLHHFLLDNKMLLSNSKNTQSCMLQASSDSRANLWRNKHANVTGFGQGHSANRHNRWYGHWVTRLQNTGSTLLFSTGSEMALPAKSCNLKIEMVPDHNYLPWNLTETVPKGEKTMPSHALQSWPCERTPGKRLLVFHSHFQLICLLTLFM